MEYTISVSDDKKYIISHFSGELTNALAEEHNTKAHTLGRSLSIDRFLVDAVDCRYVQSAAQQYEFINSETPMQEVMNRYARIAILVDSDDHSHDFF